MEERCDSIALDMDNAPWGGQQYLVSTSFGPISVTVCGDHYKPALITYPDIGLNYVACFEGLFSCPEASSVLFHNFCVYHIDPPGHEIGAPDWQHFYLSVDDLADQVAEVLDYFGLDEVIGLGVTGGAYILSLFACKYADRALGLILVSPLARAPSWTEWLHNQVSFSNHSRDEAASVQLLSRKRFSDVSGKWGCVPGSGPPSVLLRHGRICQGDVLPTVLQSSEQPTYFEPGVGWEISLKEVRDAAASFSGADVLTTIRQYMEDRRSQSVMHYLQAIHQRHDLSEDLKQLKCRTLILVGDQSPFHHESLHINHAMNRRYNALIEVKGAGSLVTEERPQSMLVPIELFLTGYAFYQRPLASLTTSPESPLSPPCTPAEVLSSESLGLKLKPIKTRATSSPEL